VLADTLVPVVSKSGHSGYPISSGRVIRVLRNSGNEICYPITAPKKRYPQIRVRIRLYPIYPKYIESQYTLKQHRILHRTSTGHIN
jgi:hypothetical protein